MSRRGRGEVCPVCGRTFEWPGQLDGHIRKSHDESPEELLGLSLSPLEDAQLRRLVHQGHELRETPYLQDAAQAIVDWHEWTLPDRLERRARAQTAARRRAALRRGRR